MTCGPGDTTGHIRSADRKLMPMAAVDSSLVQKHTTRSGPYLVCVCVGGGRGQLPPPPPVIVEKVPFLRAGALFLMPNIHQQQGALLNLGLPSQQF